MVQEGKGVIMVERHVCYDGGREEDGDIFWTTKTSTGNISKTDV